jgi:hypothetical protein
MTFLRAVANAISWRNLLATQAVALVLAALRWFEFGAWGLPVWARAACFFNFPIAALCVLLAALCADESVSRGTRPLRTYSIALVAACAVTSVLQWYLRLWFGPAGMPQGFGFTDFAIPFVDVMFLGGVGMLAYANRRTADRILESVRRAELSRVRLEQQLIESRLATAEAQIDPRMLFEALREIRSSLARAEPQADTQLDRLIRRLRNALARTVVAGESGHATQ